MLRHMRTTVRLDEGLLEQARREAARRGVTLTALIEQGLRMALRRPRSSPRAERVRLPVSRATGGVLPGIDLNDSADLLDRMGDRN
jgi:hypothetical protein